jgi:hypothetical protein
VGEAEGAIGVRVERTGPRALRVAGRTTFAPVVQVSVEDGHNILFGPADVPVRDGRFAVDATLEPTERARVFVYVTDPRGMSQTVVAMDRDTRSATSGPTPAAAP